MEFLVGLDTFNCERGVLVVKCSAMREDAEDAAKKLNKKEFFGKIVTAEIAKPKRHESVPDIPSRPKPLSEEKKEEKELRLHTIVIFGIPRHMKIDTLKNKLDPIINKQSKLESQSNAKSKSKSKSKAKSKSKSDPASENRLEWPCPAPFTSDNLSFGVDTNENHPVAHVIVAEPNMSSIKEVFSRSLFFRSDRSRTRRSSRAFRAPFVDDPREPRELREMPDDRAEYPVQSGVFPRLERRSAIRASTICSAVTCPSTASRSRVARTATRRATASCSCSATAMWRRWWRR